MREASACQSPRDPRAIDPDRARETEEKTDSFGIDAGHPERSSRSCLVPRQSLDEEPCRAPAAQLGAYPAWNPDHRLVRTLLIGWEDRVDHRLARTILTDQVPATPVRALLSGNREPT